MNTCILAPLILTRPETISGHSVPPIMYGVAGGGPLLIIYNHVLESASAEKHVNIVTIVIIVILVILVIIVLLILVI